MVSKWLTFVAVLTLVGCGSASTAETSSPTLATTSSSTTTAIDATGPPTTTVASPTKTVTPTEPGITMEDVVAKMQVIIDQSFEASDPPEGVTGPDKLECLDTGPLHRGSVFACVLWPQADPGLALEAAGVVAYVTDDEGTAAWVAGTDTPGTTEQLRGVYDASSKGLYCRDLVNPEYQYWFNTGDRGPASYVLTLVYWALEDEPDRMDEDRNGVPCETVFDPDVVQEVLAGGPMQ